MACATQVIGRKRIPTDLAQVLAEGEPLKMVHNHVLHALKRLLIRRFQAHHQGLR
jgi:hypothetical protein